MAEQLSAGIRVRRARRQDLTDMVRLVHDASESQSQVNEAEAMDWLFGKGLLVAVHNKSLVGLAAWQAENLVSVTDGFYLFPPSTLTEAGGALLAAIEAEATRLMCEANVLVLPAWTSEATRSCVQAHGYEDQAFEALHRIWREVLDEFVSAETDLMVKRLRDRMIMAPP